MNNHQDAYTILGLDPATVTGWAVLEVDGASQRVTSSGTWGLVGGGANTDDRILGAYDWLYSRLDPGPWQPDLVAIETPFMGLNAQTLITLAQVGAAYRLAIAQRGIPVVEVAPAQRCAALGIPGNADKSQVLAAVNMIYRLQVKNYDQADAIAVAAAGAKIHHETRLERLYANFQAGG